MEIKFQGDSNRVSGCRKDRKVINLVIVLCGVN